MATRANQQEFEDARRRLTAAVSADQSLDYVGDSGIVALSTTRGARSGELRRRRPADTSLALAGDATVPVSPRRGGVPGGFEELEPQPEPAVDVAPPPPPSAERTFVGRPRTPGKKLAVETTAVRTPEGFRRDTSFQDRIMQTGRYAPGPLTPGDTTADSIDAIGADLSPIAMQSDISAADVSNAVGVLSGALAEGRAQFDEYAARIDAGEFDSSDDEALDDEASDDDGFDTSSEHDDGFDTSSEHEDDPPPPAIAGPRGAVGPRGAPGVPGAAAPAAVRDRWDRASLEQRLALAKQVMAQPAIAKLVKAGVIRFSDLVDGNGAVDYQALQGVRGSLVQMQQDAADSYKQAVAAKGFDRSGEQAAVIRGMNTTIPGNRSIGGSKYVIWQGATYANEG